MPRPLVLAYHLVWTGYGWWLPNDPRGSTSRTVSHDRIAELGPLHFGRRETQPSGRVVRQFYERAAGVLMFPLLHFDNEQIQAIASAFADEISGQRYTCYACAIMPDHVHILIRQHKHKAEEMIVNLQRSSRLRLSSSARIDPKHPIWTNGGWKGFLDSPEAIRRTIRYIDENPVQARRPQQRWPFVTEYDNWPLHLGHNPNSPYARRLRARNG